MTMEDRRVLVEDDPTANGEKRAIQTSRICREAIKDRKQPWVILVALDQHERVCNRKELRAQE